MKASPDPEGNIILHAETPSDWDVLRSIARDGAGFALAEAMGGLMESGPAGQDWHDFVVPELEDAFSKQLEFIARGVSDARENAHGGPGPIPIRREDAEIWYGALNQARLALDNHYGLSDADAEVMSMSRPRRTAYFRSHIYLRIQSMLLDHLMRP